MAVSSLLPMLPDIAIVAVFAYGAEAWMARVLSHGEADVMLSVEDPGIRSQGRAREVGSEMLFLFVDHDSASLTG